MALPLVLADGSEKLFAGALYLDGAVMVRLLALGDEQVK